MWPRGSNWPDLKKDIIWTRETEMDAEQKRRIWMHERTQLFKEDAALLIHKREHGRSCGPDCPRIRALRSRTEQRRVMVDRFERR